MVNPVFSSRKTSDPDEEKELSLEGAHTGPVSLTDEQANKIILRNFQPKRFGLLKTLGDRLHLRRDSLIEQQAQAKTEIHETPGLPGEGKV